jgi:general secretion pathway protein K
MRDAERGYALLLAIAVVALLSLAVLASARALSDVTASAARFQAARNEVIAAESVMSRVAFLLLTEETGARSVRISDAQGGDELRLDGGWRHVSGSRGTFVSVQDEAGLFNFNATDEQGLAALLLSGGAGEAAPALAAALMDYTDGDDLARDRGAEAPAYARAGLAPPVDRPLSSRWQALEALGWRQQVSPRGITWTWLASGPAETGLNVNTAPEPVLAAVLGDRRQARTIVRQREAAPLTDMIQVEALTAGTVRANGVTFAVAPGRAFRVQAVFGSQGPRHGIERRLELGSGDAAIPFKWTEEREVGLASLRDGEAINSLSLAAPAS